MNELIYLLMGGNMGDRVSYLIAGKDHIASRCGEIVSCSAIYETAAWGHETQQSFLNLAIGIRTTLTPPELLKEINKIEQELGRQRMEKWGARTMDIDIIFYKDLIINTPDLRIPHPLMQERRFVLVPLHEIAPGLIHPVFMKTVGELLSECKDELPVSRFDTDMQKQS